MRPGTFLRKSRITLTVRQRTPYVSPADGFEVDLIVQALGFQPVLALGTLFVRNMGK